MTLPIITLCVLVPSSGRTQPFILSLTFSLSIFLSPHFADTNRKMPLPPPFWFYISSCSSFNPAHTNFLLTPFYCTIRFRFACLSFSSVHKSVDQHIVKRCSVLYFYIMPLFADHHTLTLCTTSFYFSLLQSAYRVKISDTPSALYVFALLVFLLAQFTKVLTNISLNFAVFYISRLCHFLLITTSYVMYHLIVL